MSFSLIAGTETATPGRLMPLLFETGPGTSTTVPSWEVFQRAFREGQVGSAAAVAIVLTVLIFAINLAVNRVGERER